MHRKRQTNALVDTSPKLKPKAQKIVWGWMHVMYLRPIRWKIIVCFINVIYNWFDLYCCTVYNIHIHIIIFTSLQLYHCLIWIDMGLDQTSKSPIKTLQIRDSAYFPHDDWWYSSSHQKQPLIIICPSIYSALLSITPRPSQACFTAISFVFVIVVIIVVAVIIVIIAIIVTHVHTWHLPKPKNA